MNIDKVLSELTREEKVLLVAGTNFMYTNPIPRLNIPGIRMSDGPHGLRVQQEGGDNGTSNSDQATCFPTAAATAMSWNPENAYLVGRAIGEECRHFGIHVVLGPGVNIKRNPLGGRCFEYFSEDPYLAGKMGAAEVMGIQSEGAGVSIKHFALNNSENYRFMGDSVADMRAIREIYLKPFEMIVKSAKPQTLMCAYNKINGEYCSQNKWLLMDVLRNEWGFDGLVMTDWGATHDRLAMLRSGLDLEMPGDTAICRKWIMDGLESGELDEADLDKAVRNVLQLVDKHENDEIEEADFDAHHEIAKKVAVDSGVLLKNDGVLPLNNDREYFIVGELFEKMRYQGAGSSMINPMHLSSPMSAFNSHGVRYTYAKGYREDEVKTDKNVLNDALSAAAKFDSAIVFAGLTDYVESEGADRESMSLPENQLDLIESLLAAGKRVAVVLFGGSPAELPFADKADAILYMCLPGQNGGEATYSLVFGESNPSGRLAESWPINYSDVPFGNCFGIERNEIYKESIFVGYRYYTGAGVNVRYPFGYGLSYTKFEYSDILIRECDGKYIVSCKVTNTGDRNGAEVVQLYVGAPGRTVFRPIRELKGFTKLYLNAGETKVAEITVDAADLKYFDVKKDEYVTESGEYRFEICANADRVILACSIEVAGDVDACPYSDRVLDVYREFRLSDVTDELFEEMSGLTIPKIPNKTPIGLESRFSDMKSTFMGRILYKSVLSVAEKDMKKAKKLPEGIERDNKIKGALMLRRVLNSNSLVSMSMCARDSFPYNMAEAFAHLANGKIISGVKKICSAVNAPAPVKEKENKK